MPSLPKASRPKFSRPILDPLLPALPRGGQLNIAFRIKFKKSAYIFSFSKFP